jgi:hypothetical protein
MASGVSDHLPFATFGCLDDWDQNEKEMLWIRQERGFCSAAEIVAVSERCTNLAQYVNHIIGSGVLSLVQRRPP